MTVKLSNLRQLVDIVSANIDIIEDHSKAQGVNYPTLDTIYDACSPSESFTSQPQVLDAALIAVSAASQLIATLKLPVPCLFERATGFHVSSALRVATDACAVELLREAGPKGMHVRNIATRTGLESSIIGRSLRLLATHYIFKEVEPDVFANNRLSSAIDTGKSSEFLASLTRRKVEDPSREHAVAVVQKEKYEDTNGVAALMDICTDYNYKSSSFISDVFIKNDMCQSPFQAAHQYGGTFWDFLEDHPGHLRRFQKSMEAWTLMSPENIQASRNGFDWSTLPDSAVVVDVGGGNGSVSFDIARSAPHLTVVVQDRPQTIDNVAIPSWESDPEKRKLLKSGQVKLEGHSFFEEQPTHIRGKIDMFFMRYILHDWPTADCAKILSRLHDAASSSTKLLIVDQVVPYACANVVTKRLFEGSSLPAAPAPLLANLGEANSPTYHLDMGMKALFNGQERTLGEFQQLTEEAGWRIEKIYQTKGSAISQILCSKV